MGALIRIVQSLPLIIALAVIAAVVYFVVAALRSPTRAKEVLIRVFLVLTIALSTLFLLGTLYSLLESNIATAEFFGVFLAISAIALAITLICRWRFRKNHPNYRYSAQHTRTHFRWEKQLRQILNLLKGGSFRGPFGGPFNGPFNPRS